MAGTAALQRQDYRGAVAYLERLRARRAAGLRACPHGRRAPAGSARRSGLKGDAKVAAQAPVNPKGEAEARGQGG